MALGAGRSARPLTRRALGGETSARQVFHRMAGAWTYWGWKGGYFDSEADARTFYDEHCFMLAAQMAAPNSPQWFNTGLHWAYGIDGPGQGHWYVDHRDGEAHPSDSSYERPQPHACFIQGVADELVSDGGIMDLWVREARLFKYGSGTGSNFSQHPRLGREAVGRRPVVGPDVLPQDRRSCGGRHQVGRHDAARGQDGRGRHRPSRHRGVHLLEDARGAEGRRAGRRLASSPTGTSTPSCRRCEDGFEPKQNPRLRREIVAARRAEISENYIQRVIQFARQGYRHIEFPTFDTDWQSEAYATVSGQNANNSVRVTDDFLQAVAEDREWALTARTTGKSIKTVSARGLWDRIAEAAWHSADPGVQFDTTINDWHTCPESGRINASNPCSEYMFLDDTACNLASLNLMRFRHEQDGSVDVEALEHASRLWTVVLEISVMMAQYPSRRIAELSYRYRTLGLGYANLGALLMARGLGYDSARGRGDRRRHHRGHDRHGLCDLGRDGRQHGRLPRLRRQSRGHAAGHPQPPPRRLRPGGRLRTAFRSPPVALDIANCPDAALVAAARRAWDQALALGEQHGFRNAQVSVIAPTGTIGLVMDCDTTGIEPDFALVKFKKLAGGGYFKIINQTVPLALRDPRLRRGDGGADRRACGRPRHAEGRAGDQPRDPGGARLRQGGARSGREGAGDGLRHPLRLLALHPGRRFLPRGPGSRRQRARRSAARPAGATRLLTHRHRCSRTSTRAARCRSKARPISSASTFRCSIVQIPVDEMAHAACLQRVTYA